MVFVSVLADFMALSFSEEERGKFSELLSLIIKIIK